MPLSSNISNTLIPIADAIKQLTLETELKQIADDAVLKIKSRIAKGLGPNGEILNTKSRDRIGRYSRWHGENRRYAGLTTSIRNLSFTGDMLASFKTIKTTPNQSEIGFDSVFEAKIANQNESYMDIEVFVPNDNDVKEGQEIITKKINSILK